MNETVDNSTSVVVLEAEDGGFLIGFGLFNPVAVMLGIIGVGVLVRRDEEAW